MPIKIKVADTTSLIDESFRLRYKVFVEQEGYIEPNSQQRVFDRFDAFPTTFNLVSMLDNVAVGAFRLAIDSSQGLPADSYYDFRQHIPDGAVLMHGGMFCIDREYRSGGMAMGLILMASYLAMTKGVTHVVAPINPAIGNMLKRIGFKQVADEFMDPQVNIAVLPLILDVAEVKDFFLNFIRQNELHDFLCDYQRWFYKAGETIISAGTEGNEAFVIIEGAAQVQLPNTDTVVATVEEGGMLGELALITDEPRSADVIAKQDVVVMVINKDVFLHRFMNSPEHALKLLKLLGNRTQDMLKQLQLKDGLGS
ncbi:MULTISPECIES: N-acyl amino acid synthase FeeM domain-containing protein [Pseudoalteromonas]|uniref:Cyclic nucleotide-binding domain protein n=1 Tax=Pseudoalteromonas luteoviolacea (strain 2ta16) TaxID=1353533 RepID=V4HTS4_PSEL2|nr:MULTISPECIES: cyclic nucleotide-binding domain-containing protein [Pseudoalteromonas]ESP93198.1 cyclic nucleotide-binding domain protein [Pseudoalteromonas luteoviolacea 2ta16]KZN37071.1 hypothetical protein N483_21740 [Pseudoalteromonas luteoviolacea NCIMB 1944]MCG7550000.1 cyclic nucleotide-binding domain-containing protein [Pseudoalteromonas sp. Of7M-16]